MAESAITALKPVCSVWAVVAVSVVGFSLSDAVSFGTRRSESISTVVG